jgi:hypothetical protein
MREIRLALPTLLAVVALATVGCGDDVGSVTTESTTGLPKLIATVGSTDDADAYEIKLTTEDGAEVTTRLPPGEYLLEINDLSTIHNFHLGGALAKREVATDVATDVAGTAEKTTIVVLRDHESYHYFCDAHPATMNVTFSVHGWPLTRN